MITEKDLFFRMNYEEGKGYTWSAILQTGKGRHVAFFRESTYEKIKENLDSGKYLKDALKLLNEKIK